MKFFVVAVAVLALIIILLPFSVASDQFCIFPLELQGEYRIQNAALNGNNRVQYSVINITDEGISPYGLCYSRNGSNFIVNLRYEKIDYRFHTDKISLGIN